MFKKTVQKFLALVLTAALICGGSQNVQAQDAQPTQFLFLPIVQRDTVVTQEPGWLNVTASAMSTETSICGQDLLPFNPAVASSLNDICLLPGRFPVLVTKVDGKVQSYTQGGWNSNGKNAWSFATGTQGATKFEAADVIQIDVSAPITRSGIQTLPSSDVTVLRMDNMYNGVSSAALATTPSPAQILEFYENLMSYRDLHGAIGLQFNASASQVFVNPLGIPGKMPSQCGANPDDGTPVIPQGESTLIFTNFSARLAISVLFVGDEIVPGFPTMAACMGEYDFIPLVDLMLKSEYENVRQEMKDKGFDSWEGFAQWKVYQPSPAVAYAISWVVLGGVTIYTAAQYTAQGVLQGASSFFIVPTEAIECLQQGGPRVCRLNMQQLQTTK